MSVFPCEKPQQQQKNKIDFALTLVHVRLGRFYRHVFWTMTPDKLFDFCLWEKNETQANIEKNKRNNAKCTSQVHR